MPLRPSQHRGIPWLASAITNLHQLEGFIESQVIRARASSALMGFISNSEGEIDAGGEVFQNERVKSFQPGVFHYLNQGEEVTIPNIDASSGDFEPFIRENIKINFAIKGKLTKNRFFLFKGDCDQERPN